MAHHLLIAGIIMIEKYAPPILIIGLQWGPISETERLDAMEVKNRACLGIVIDSGNKGLTTKSGISSHITQEALL
jgi:hypothetical protein